MTKNYGRYKENDLVEMVVKKDRGAMKFLYDRYAEYLSAVCGRYIADENDRKDVLQECFIKIFMSLSTFEYRGDGSLKAWMARITVNESLKFIRKSATYSFIEYGENVPDTADEPEVEGVPDDVINKMILSLLLVIEWFSTSMCLKTKVIKRLHVCLTLAKARRHLSSPGQRPCLQNVLKNIKQHIKMIRSWKNNG